jgi:amidase
MSPMGLGNDIGGSLRNPAFACGITSIKPSRGRVPQGNPSSCVEMSLDAQIMLAEGPLARHVGDLRRGLVALMGAHHGDPQSVDVPLVGPPASRQVALVANAPGGDTDPDIAEGVRAAGRALEAAGYEVEEVDPPMFFETCLSWAQLIWSGISTIEPLLMAKMGEDGRRFLELTDVGFEPATAESIAAMHQDRQRVARAWREFLTSYPLIVGPTWTHFPFELGSDIRDQTSALKVAEIVRFVLPANLLGLPAVCVPTGLVNGLPTGAQIIGDVYREDLCLDAAQVVERTVGVLTPIDPRT